MTRLEKLLNNLDSFEQWDKTKQVDFVVYFLLQITKKQSVTGAEIDRAFKTVGLHPYSRTSAYLSENSKGHGLRKYIKADTGYTIEKFAKAKIKSEVENRGTVTNLSGLKPPMDPYLRLFDQLTLHKKIINSSRKLFSEKNYRPAVLEAYISLVDSVRKKSGISNDGTSLMQEVFSEKAPVLVVSANRDEQIGFMWLFSGAVMGVRNPKAHYPVPQKDPIRALEWLSFASVLFRVLDESKKIR
jgi:uncharacterized protein (TIGR02391 family)